MLQQCLSLTLAQLQKQGLFSRNFVRGSGEGMFVSPQIGGRQCRAAREVHPFAFLTMRLLCSEKWPSDGSARGNRLHKL